MMLYSKDSIPISKDCNRKFKKRLKNAEVTAILKPQ